MIWFVAGPNEHRERVMEVCYMDTSGNSDRRLASRGVLKDFADDVYSEMELCER